MVAAIVWICYPFWLKLGPESQERRLLTEISRASEHHSKLPVEE